MMPRGVGREGNTMVQALVEEAEDEDEEVVGRMQVEPAMELSDTMAVMDVQPMKQFRPRQCLIRRSSSAVYRMVLPSPQEEVQDGGDKALRPRFLQERSATIVHITPQVAGPTRAPRSKASAFLLDVLTKSRSPSAADSRLEPLHLGATNSLHYVPPEGVERGAPLRLAGQTSRRFARQLPIGPSLELLEREAAEGARQRRVSVSKEHFGAVVRALQASRQQLNQQLDILHTVLRFINVIERDDNGKRPELKAMVDEGIIPELASIMREFRFHTGLQICVMSILTALVEESSVYAYMMSECNLEKLLHKTTVVHAREDRLITLASNLLHALTNSKNTTIISAYQAEKVAKVRRQSVTYTDMLVAAITTKPRQSPSPSAKSSDKWGPESRPRQALSLDVAPPALSAKNYQLLFSQKLKKPEISPLPAVENDSALTSEQQELRDRPVSSPPRRPLVLDLTPRSLTAAIYSGGSIFVEPSPLSKRLPHRGSFSAGGVRRKLCVTKKNYRVQTSRLPPTGLASAVEAPTSKTPEAPPSKSLDIEEVPVIENNVAAESTTSSDEGSVHNEEFRDEEVEKEKEEGEDEDEESYEDDFDITVDGDSDGDKKMPSRRCSSQIGSDSELIEMLHEIPDTNSLRSASTSEEENAATTIQRHIRGLLVRREYARPLRNVSGKMAVKGLMKTNGGESDRRRSKRERVKTKRKPLASRAHQQLQNLGYNQRDRREVGLKSVSRRSVTAVSPVSLATGSKKVLAKTRPNGFQHQSQETNNQLLSPSRSSQLEGWSMFKQAIATSTSEVEPDHLTETVKPPDPEALKQIQTLYAEGLQHHKENHLGLAIECYEKALVIPGGREFASLYVNLGSALMAQNKFSNALESFGQAKRIQPDNIKAIYNSSLALLHLDRRQMAKRLLRRILELEPTHEKATIALSHLQGSVKSPATHAPKHDDT